MAVASVQESLLPELEDVLARGRGVEPEALQRLRRAAASRFVEVGWPSRRDEAWRQTDVTPIAAGSFATRPGGVPEGAADALAAVLARLVVPGAWTVVLVDGRFAPGLSRLAGLPEGVAAGGLADAIRREPDAVMTHLGALVGASGHAFAARNTALFADGAYVRVARGATVERPLQVVHVGTAEGGATAARPRVLLVAEEAAEATVIESYASLGGGAHLCEAVTEVWLAPAARIDHYKVQVQGERSYHVAVQRAALARDASLVSHAFTFGAALARNDVDARLAGEGGSLVLNGLYVVAGDQHADTHMVVEHAAPRCESHELYKGVLDGRASAVFDGLIHVREGAQKTNAKQANRNLLLSREAVANSNPQLRIFADDVKCTHGSTVGELDADALFYLRSRGIGADAARAILTRAFAGEVVARVRPEGLRRQIEGWLAARLPMDAAPEGPE